MDEEKVTTTRVNPYTYLVGRFVFEFALENATSSSLPHGRVSVREVARSLGISQRTLARRLSDEALAFSAILQDLKRDLHRGRSLESFRQLNLLAVDSA